MFWRQAPRRDVLWDIDRLTVCENDTPLSCTLWNPPPPLILFFGARPSISRTICPWRQDRGWATG